MFNLGTIKTLGQFLTKQDECGPFHDALEALQLSPESSVDPRYVLAQMPLAARRHAHACPTCMEAVEDFVAVRNLLLPLTSATPSSPDPWFSSKVIQAIVAQEGESDRSEAVWASVRSLAPRLAAFSALLLVVAGTWAFQMKQQSQIRQMIRPVETLFEPTPAAPLNDDVMASLGERR
jgi:hypothetical protein